MAPSRKSRSRSIVCQAASVVAHCSNVSATDDASAESVTVRRIQSTNALEEVNLNAFAASPSSRFIERWMSNRSGSMP